MKKPLLMFMALGFQSLVGWSFTVDNLTYSINDNAAVVTGASSTGVTKISIPATVTYGGTEYPVTTISGNAFQNCKSLREVVIEEADTYIASPQYVEAGVPTALGNPFAGCPVEKFWIGRNLSLRYSNGDIVGDMTSIFSSSADNVDITYAGKTTYITATPEVIGLNRSNIRSITIGGNVEHIYKNAFKGLTGIKKFELLPGETQIDISNEGFLQGCDIDSLIIGRDYSSLAYYPNSLTNVVLTSGLQRISNEAVRSIAIKTVTVEDSTTPLDLAGISGVFYGCSIDSLYYGRYLGDNNTSFIYAAEVKNITFGPNIKNIYSYFTTKREVLQSVTLSPQTERIGSNAFNRAGISEIIFPETLKVIEEGAFTYCTNLVKADLPSKIDSIGYEAFRNTALTSVTIPKSVDYIGSDAFRESNVKTVIIEDSETPITLGFGSVPFYGCSLDSLYYGRYIGEDNSSFIYGAELKSINFGPNIKNLNSYLLRGHQELQSVTFSSQMERIENNAFNGCINLASIVSHAENPPVCEDESVFESSIYPTATVTVPVGTRKIYKAAEVWKNFTNLFSDGGYSVKVTYDSALGSVTLNGEATDNLIIDEDEALTISINPADGCRIASVKINGKDVSASITDGKIIYDSLDENLDINVEFELLAYNITIPSEITGGRLEILAGDETWTGGTISHNTAMTIHVIPDTGYELKSFTINGEDKTSSLSDDLTITLEVNRDIIISAEFTPIVYTITATSNAGGTVMINESEGECKVEFGKPLVITVKPIDEGHFISSLTVDSIDVTDQLKDGVLKIERVERNMEVTAVFDVMRFTTKLSYDTSLGEITTDLPMDGESFTAEFGQTVKLDIRPNEGYEISSITLDGDDITTNVERDGGILLLTYDNTKGYKELTVNFGIKHVYLTVIGLEGGTISMSYDYNMSTSILINPEEGWEFHSLTVDGEVITELEADNSYVIESMTDDKEISLVFKKQSDSGIATTVSSNLTVSAIHDTITISGADEASLAEVFDTAGRCLYKGYERSININNKGVHIVVIENQSFKVLLR